MLAACLLLGFLALPFALLEMAYRFTGDSYFTR